MKHQFEELFIRYLSENRNVDSTSSSYDYVCRSVPREMRQRLDRDDLIVKGSIGIGNRNDYPWIAILNSEITRSTQQGVYIVYLFKKDMSGVYLTLSQGITNFERKYKTNKYTYAELVAKEFQKELQDYDRFTKNPIDLVATKGSLGYGYEKTTIISKYYERGHFSENELWDDLFVMLQIYDTVYEHMGNQTYDEIIEKIISDGKDDIVDGDTAITEINQALREDANYPIDIKKSLVLVSASQPRSQRFKKFRKSILNKVDYLKKAVQDIATGLDGEQLVIDYEKKRLLTLGLDEYSDKVDWVSKKSDSYGYDIKSYDIDSAGKVFEIFIEVKTTTSKVDTDFIVTRKELETSKIYQNQFCIYRIINITSTNPNMYKAKGIITDNFYLDNETYTAQYKWKVV